MVALLQLASWTIGLLAAAGLGLGLALMLFPEFKKWPTTLLERHLFPDANQVVLKNTKALKTGELRKVYRILAFGDSLTEGFTRGGQHFHPYAKRVGDRIYPQLPQGWHLEVEEQGESGERVLISMKHRLQRTLDEHATAKRHYDWVLLLGGINDLGGDQSTAEEVMSGLEVLVDAALLHGANVMLMTIMEVAMPEPAVEQQRVKLNQLIKQYVQDRKWAKTASTVAAEAGASGADDVSSASSRTSDEARQGQQQQQGSAQPDSQGAPISRRGAPRVELFDLAAGLTWSGMDEETRWQMWDDGVHLTMDGYDHMGGLIADALLPHIKEELAAEAAAAAPDPATGGSHEGVNGDGDQGRHKRD